MKKILLFFFCASFSILLQAQNLIPFERNGKWGYIDKAGNTVIPFDYNEAWDFKNEKNYDGTPKIYAHVRKGSDEFCIDKTGKRIRCW